MPDVSQRFDDKTKVFPSRSEKVTLETLMGSLRNHEKAMNGNPNDPLCPLLPSVKRNINNKLAMFLETDIAANKRINQ